MSGQVSLFPQAKAREFQRSIGIAGPTYICPLCKEREFTQEVKLWSHAKNTHPGELKLIGSTTEAEAEEREKFKRAAYQEAQSRALSTSKPSYNGKPPSDTEKIALQSAAASIPRPSTAPEIKEERPRPEQAPPQLIAAQSTNPKKRGGPGSSPDPVAESRTSTHPQLRARHHKSISSGYVDADSERRKSAASHTTPQKKIFDHRAEAPISGGPPRRPRTAGSNARGRQGQATAGSTKRGVDSPPDSRPQTLGKLVQPGLIEARTIDLPKSNRVTLGHTSQVSESQSVEQLDEPDDVQSDPSMFRQPETRPISHDQLVAEVKGIYAGLVMVEAKCIEVDEKQTMASQNPQPEPLLNDQWKSLIALHKQLLHEHHDFFLASQHPSASHNLSRLAGKYSMPARMWRHGIHGFLEVLRHRLPESFEQMLAFIYIAYSMMALLYETVPAFEDTWIECLGDLARYRMAIEDGEPRDRENWSGVARYWYAKASDRSPHIGRLYHHLAILARHYSFEQLSLYLRALTCITPFDSAKGSVMVLFTPALEDTEALSQRVPDLERLGIVAHGMLFTYPEKTIADFYRIFSNLKGSIDKVVRDAVRHPSNRTQPNRYKLRKSLVFLTLSNISGLLGYGILTVKGDPKSQVRRAFDKFNFQVAEKEAFKQAAKPEKPEAYSAKDDWPQKPPHQSRDLSEADEQASSVILDNASDMAFFLFNHGLLDKHWVMAGEDNPEKDLWLHYLPSTHIMLVFILYATLTTDGTITAMLIRRLRRDLLCRFLNRLLTRPKEEIKEAFRKSFPIPSDSLPLWEDFQLRGQVYSSSYYPETFFSDAGLADEERQLETTDMDVWRVERVLWLGFRIAALEKWFRFNEDIKQFETVEGLFSPSSPQLEITQSAMSNEQYMGRDISMPDVPMPDRSSRSTTLGPSSEAGEVSMAPSIATPSTPPLDSATDFVTPRENPATPRIPAADEPEDVPMMDISPGKEQPTNPLDSVAAKKWRDDPPPVYSRVAPMDS